MNEKSERRAGRLAWIVLVAWAVAAQVPCFAASTYETPTGLRADQYLAPELMTGPDWKVESAVTNDGLGNTYTITSRFGVWEARGIAQVRVRIHEIHALAELEEVSKSEVFVDAVKNSVTAPIDLVANVASRPVETVKAIPSSIGRWFKTTTFKVSETFHDASEASKSQKTKQDQDSAAEPEQENPASDKGEEMARKEALSYLKITSAERHWYLTLGVDPSSDNQVLRAGVSSVARVEGLTKFGMKFAGLPSVPFAGELRDTMDLVWKTDPWELRRLNRKELLDAGLSKETARAFEDNPYLTLTLQTGLLQMLKQLGGVGGRSTVIARGIDAASREEAAMLGLSVSMMLRFHREQSPLAEIVAGTRLPVARKASGELVAFLPTDALFWTEDVARAAETFAKVYEQDPAKARQLWVTGEASERFESGSRELGWGVRDRWSFPLTETGETGEAGEAGAAPGPR